jgi:hypothetical protein
MALQTSAGAFLLLAPSLLLAGCNDNSAAPAPAPTIVEAAGTWVGPIRVTSVTGGECGESMQYLVNSTQTVRLTVQQNGSEVAAQTMWPGNATCTLTGSATATGITLTSSRCDMPPNYVNYTFCTGVGGRELSTRSLSISLTINRNAATGQFTQVDDARPVGGNVTSSMTLIGEATLSR